MKAFSRIFAVMAAAAMACALVLPLAGCAGGQSQSSDAGPGFDVESVKVDGSGFTIGADGTLRYAFIAVNPNDGHVASNVIFSIEGYNENGQMVAGGGATIPVMYPGVKAGGSGTTQLFARDGQVPNVARLEISANMDAITWSDTSYTATDVQDLVSVENASLDNVGADLSISADLSTTASQNIDVYTVSILKDANGNPIVGSDSQNYTLNAGGDAAIYGASISDVPEYSSCELFTMPTTLM